MILTHNGLRWYLLQFQCDSDTDKWHARPKTRRGRKEEPVVLAGVCMCADQRGAFRLRGMKNLESFAMTEVIEKAAIAGARQ